MICFPNAKINLGLNVTARRPDGYHDIETVFYPVPVRDVLEILPATDGMFRFRLSGLPIPGDKYSNLVIKAYRYLAERYALPPVHIYLFKAIPMGSGTGGGSSDGAFALKALNDLFHLSMSDDQLLSAALHLGSDCPFFLGNRPVLAKGRGEKLSPVDVTLSDFTMVISYPGIHIDTAWAYSQVTPNQPAVPVENVVIKPMHYWREELRNDFEAPVFEKYPAIREIRDQFYKDGALFASMTGSGSAVFALFDGEGPYYPTTEVQANGMTRINKTFKL